MEFLINWGLSIPSFATVYALAAFGLLLSERTGVLNLGAEGFMLFGALAGVGAMVLGAEPLVAIFMSAIAGLVSGVLFSGLTVYLRINHVIAGLVLVFFALSATSYISESFNWGNIAIRGLDPIFLGFDLIVWSVPIFGIFLAWLFNVTRLGLRLEATGNDPAAADAAGVNVSAYRFMAVLAGSALLGLAGGYLTVGVTKIWVDNVTAGRGWIAIALLIFAGWRPLPVIVGAILFGGIEAVIPRMEAAGIEAPRYILQMFPYLATIVVMIIVSATGMGRSRQPSALGHHFIREDRN